MQARSRSRIRKLVRIRNGIRVSNALTDSLNDARIVANVLEQEAIQECLWWLHAGQIGSAHDVQLVRRALQFFEHASIILLGGQLVDEIALCVALGSKEG